MTAVQLDSMTAQAYRDLTAITENENIFRVVARYLRKKVQELATDSTEMTKEEFFARVDKANQGPSYRMLPKENLTEFMRRHGYDV